MRKLVSKQVKSNKGRTLALHHKGLPLVFRQTLLEQGIRRAAELSCTFVPTNLWAAWCFVTGVPTPDEEFAMEGLTDLAGAGEGDYLQNLPHTLQSLTFGGSFNQNMQGVTLPGSLQSLTFGNEFDQNMHGVTLPDSHSLQSLTFGGWLNQSMQGVTLPGSLQSLTFGHAFDQNMQGVSLPDSLQSLTFGGSFNQRDFARQSSKPDFWE